MSHKNSTFKLPHKFLRHNFKCFLLQCFYTLLPRTQFIDNWHIDLILEYLKAIEASKLTRFIINIPPRNLKSTIISVSWTAWLLGKDPTKKIIIASYSLNLSFKHSQDTRHIMNSDWYRKVFPKTVIAKGSNEKAKFVTTEQGFRMATSVYGTLTGEGADVLIIDDPLTPIQAVSSVKRQKVNDWFEQTFSTRLNDKKKGVILIIMQRLHQDDLSGYLLQKNYWSSLILPAICEQDTCFSFGNFSHNFMRNEFLNPRREGHSEIERAKEELGSYGFNAQYQQAPLNVNSGIIKAEWIKRYSSMPTDYQLCYQSWDCAVSISVHADYSACTTWAVLNKELYLIDVFHAQLDFISLKNKVVNMHEMYKPAAVIIENKASGIPLIQELISATTVPATKYLPKCDKENRLLMIANLFESGKVLLPKNSAWLAEFEQELFLFPNASHDDMVDSMSQFLNWYKETEGRTINIRKL